MCKGMGHRTHALVEELASAVLETPAPKPVVELCWRLVGSRIALRADPEETRLAAFARLEEQLGRKEALRFEELVIQLRASHGVRNVDALVAALAESCLDKTRLSRKVVPLTTTARTENRAPPPARRDEPWEPNGLGAPQEVAATVVVAPVVSEAEAKLVRDVLWCLQGIDGVHVSFRSTDESYNVDRSVAVKLSTADRVRELCELGWLYRKVSRFVEENRAGSACRGALASVLSDELDEYYRLVAVLEAQLQRRDDKSQRLTLRRLQVWTVEPAERLKMMAVIVEAVVEAGAIGGEIASLVHQRAKHGDPKARSFAEKVAGRASEPIFAAVRRWLLAGELVPDPHSEFFIYQDDDAPTTRATKQATALVDSAAFWRLRYKLRIGMVPSFMHGLETQILVVGKARNFLKVCCSRPAPADEDDEAAFEYGAADRLRGLVRRVADKTNARLRRTLVDDCQLVEHLRTLKACLLLMQGDFAQRFVEALDALHDRRLVRHDVWTAFDAAVRGSNAASLATLDCLRVAVVRGRRDVTLDYEAPPPVDAVLDADALAIYRRVHVVLLKRTRAEVLLAKSWRQHLIAKRANFSFPGAGRVFHRTALARARIAQLVAAFGACACAQIDDLWTTLETKIARDGGLDDIGDAHRAYLSAIQTKALFLNLATDDEIVEHDDIASLLVRVSFAND